MRRSSQEITRLLVAWNRGEESALAELTPLVHGELRRLARSYCAVNVAITHFRRMRSSTKPICV